MAERPFVVDPADRIVGAQAAALAGLLWPGHARWSLPRPVTVAAGSAAAIGTAFSVLGASPHGSRLTPRVEPPRDASLLDSGAYAVSRHPIYGGLLLAGAGLAVLRRRPEPLVAWVALVVVLTVKTGREEVRLRERFGPSYTAYRERTPRFLGVPGRRTPAGRTGA